MASYTADDLALAALLRIVPGGYRLIDVSDDRFVGVRDRFQRLALKHIGPRPALVGFVGPGQDPVAAATAAAAWAASNLVPSAIQRRVQPGVLVIAMDPPPGTTAGMVPGMPAKTAIWTVAKGRVHASGRPPGAPAPGLLRAAVASLNRGEEPPPIGKIDVAERALMSGRPRRTSLRIGGGAVLGLVLVGYLLLRVVPGLLLGTPKPAADGSCTSQNCVVLGPGDNGRAAKVSQGMTVVVQLAAASGRGCSLQDSAPSVLEFQGCELLSGQEIDTYRAAAPGNATLSAPGFSATVTVQ